MRKKKANVPRATLEQTQLKALGRACRNGRLDQKKKLQDAEIASGVSCLTISNLEKGLLKNSSLQTLNRIAAAAGLRIILTVEQINPEAVN